jgi:hypothetical protein
MLLLYERQALVWLGHNACAAVMLHPQQVLMLSVPAVQFETLQHPGLLCAAAVGGHLTRLQVAEGWVIKPDLSRAAAG